MTRQKNTPAAATAQGETNELQNYYNNTVDGLQARIPNNLLSVALQIENGVTMLEAAADAYGALSDAPAGLLIYTTGANYQYQHDKTAQSRTERINQNRRELAAALH